MKMKPAYIIALGVIGVCMVVVLLSFRDSMTRHVDVATAKAQIGETVQVPGDILKETVSYDATRGSLRFVIADKKDRSQRLSIVYPEPKPENFDTATSVEAVGKYENGVFTAERLMVKCPSKYNDQPAAEPQKQASTFGPNEIILGGGGIVALATVTGYAIRRRTNGPGPA